MKRLFFILVVSIQTQYGMDSDREVGIDETSQRDWCNSFFAMEALNAVVTEELNVSDEPEIIEFKCPQCQRIVGNRRFHIKEHLIPALNNKDFICKFNKCEQFIEKGGLWYHLQLHEKEFNALHNRQKKQPIIITFPVRNEKHQKIMSTTEDASYIQLMKKYDQLNNDIRAASSVLSNIEQHTQNENIVSAAVRTVNQTPIIDLTQSKRKDRDTDETHASPSKKTHSGEDFQQYPRSALRQIGFYALGHLKQ